MDRTALEWDFSSLVVVGGAAVHGTIICTSVGSDFIPLIMNLIVILSMPIHVYPVVIFTSLRKELVQCVKLR